MVRTFALLYLLATILAKNANGADSIADDRARAEGVVILELLKDYPTAPVVVIYNLPTTEVNAIRRAVPSLAKSLLSTTEFKAAYRSWKNAPAGSADLGMGAVEMHPDSAIILAGTPFISLSGSHDRFVLRKRHGKWIIVHRDRDYEVATI